uniref:Uncharacterized protein n=1 Tax=Anguilla anguilla TaxID=7936 RepID=A0A0E9UYX0_ANGAN
MSLVHTGLKFHIHSKQIWTAQINIF